MIEKLDSSLFTWSRWRSGSLIDFNIPCRYLSITSEYSKRILREKIVGYCNGENLQVRPKKKHKAVMFFNNGSHFWTHLRNVEFKEVFEMEN